MSLTREQEIAELERAINEAKQRIEFLNDSNEFYGLPLGTGKKLIIYPDFNSETGIGVTQTDELSKLTQNWYRNFAGYRSEEESVALQSFKFLRAWLKLQKIHQMFYPFLYTPTHLGQPDFTQSQSSSFKWCIKYNRMGNYFYPSNEGNANTSPADIFSTFYFKGSMNNTLADNFILEFTGYTNISWGAITLPSHDSWSLDCWNAIKYMIGPEGSDSELRDLFQVSNIAQTKYITS